MATTPGAISTGMATGNAKGSNYLYAADNTGLVRVFDTSFKDVTLTTFAGEFAGSQCDAGNQSFHIQNINQNLYVTYAQVNSMGVGNRGGLVDEYDTSGNFIKRAATMGELNTPWEITLAPGRFGQFSNDLLIGQFGDGQILAYDPATDALLGTLKGRNGMIDNSFVWALNFGTGGPNINTLSLYFTAGGQQPDGWTVRRNPRARAGNDYAASCRCRLGWGAKAVAQNEGLTPDQRLQVPMFHTSKSRMCGTFRLVPVEKSNLPPIQP